MTPDNIATLVASGESETLEFKKTTGTRREATATICAMLNQRGGHVLFGITPEGRVVGLQCCFQLYFIEISQINPNRK